MSNHFKYTFIFRLFLFPVLILLAGCATTTTSSLPQTLQNLWFCEPPKHELSDKYIHVELIPQCSYWGCTSFYFSIKNKTDRQLKINWNETYYIRNGKPDGGFMFNGVIYKNRFEQKAPEILPGNRKISRTLWPNNLVFYDNRWRHQPMETGENGISFYIMNGEIAINEQLSMNLSLETVTPGDHHIPCMNFSRPDATKADWTGVSVMDTHRGVGVVNVFLSSPATYKILPGDIIREINSKPIPDKYTYLETTLSLKGSPSPILFLIERDGEEQFVPVR